MKIKFFFIAVYDRRKIGVRLLFSLIVIMLPIMHTHADQKIYKLVVENFDKPQKGKLLQGKYYGAFADPQSKGACYVFFYGGEDKVFGGRGYSLHLQWDTTKEGAYGGYWQELKGINLEPYNYLTFYVRGFEGGEIFKIGLRGKLNATYESKILITEAIKSGITDHWQKVVLPLKQFKAVETWRDMSIFSINFEAAFGSGKGQILIDDIAFEK